MSLVPPRSADLAETRKQIGGQRGVLDRERRGVVVPHPPYPANDGVGGQTQAIALHGVCCTACDLRRLDLSTDEHSVGTGV
jgi:hypothetical protein